jgi:two-component SAPR family response regulator
MRLVRHIARIEVNINTYKGLVGKHEGRRPLGRPGYMWQDDIKIYLKEIVQMSQYGGRCGVDYSGPG